MLFKELPTDCTKVIKVALHARTMPIMYAGAEYNNAQEMLLRAQFVHSLSRNIARFSSSATVHSCNTNQSRSQ